MYLAMRIDMVIVESGRRERRDKWWIVNYSLGFFFAAKILDGNAFPDKDQIARMLSEINIMTSLRHDNIVRYLGFDYR